MTKFIENKTYEEIAVGDSASISRVLTKGDIQIFAIMSGDVNPAHLDEEYASSDLFKKVIAHGMWGGALISTVLGTTLPGPGTIYLENNLQFKRPVTLGDEVTFTVKVAEKIDDKKIIIFNCICTNQVGKEVITGTAKVIAPSEKIKREIIKLPTLELVEDKVEPAYQHFLQICRKFPPLKTAVVHPMGIEYVIAALSAAQDGIIEPIFIAPKEKFMNLIEEAGLDISSFQFIASEHSHDSAEKAVDLVKQGLADAIMKAKLHTDELLGPVVAKENNLRTERRMSHSLFAISPNYHKPLLITDVAININPDLNAKKDIVQNSIDLFISLYGRAPKVAILAAVETISEKMQATLDAAALCKMAERGQIIGGIVDGPLAFDNAISQEAAEIKNIVSQVAGDADILVVPNIEAGNMIYKELHYLAKVESAGIVLGAKIPIMLLSRSDRSPMSVKMSCVISSLYHYNKDLIMKSASNKE